MKTKHKQSRVASGSSLLRAKPIAAALAVCSFHAVSAQAADTTLPEVQVTDTQARAGSANDMVITGSKTDTLLKDLPASVSVVSRDIIEQQGATDLNRALENASGVQPMFAGGYGFANNYSVRGMAMRFLRDGYPDGTSQNGYWHTMYDVERIEVLKGPGSALYGAGQPGGTVNIVTKVPRSKFGAELGFAVGSRGMRSAYADVTGPASDTVALRVIGAVEKTDGFRGLSRDITEILPSMSWAIDDTKTFNLDIDHRDIEVTPDNYGIVFDARGEIADVPHDTRYYTPTNYSKQTIDRVTLSHEWRFSNELTMRTALINDDRKLRFLRNGGANAGNPANQMTGRSARAQNDDARYNTLQNEWVWKARTGSVGHTVLGGIEFNDARIDTVRVGYTLPPITNIYAPVVPETSIAGLTPDALQGYDRRVTSRSTGVYLQDQMEFGEQFKLRAGIRSDRAKAEDKGAQGATAFREITVEDTLTSGSLGAVWQPSRDLSFYAGVATGKFINFASEATSIPRAPEESSQTEIGVKTTLCGGKCDMNLALYETERENYFITLPGNAVPTPDGKDRTRGIEADVGVRPLAGLSITANVAFQDAETLSDTRATNTIMGVVNRSIRGTRPAGVAKQSGRLWAAYELQSPELRGWGAGAGITRKGDSFADSLNLYRIPSYTLFDAAVFYKQKAWEASLNLFNLTDKRYYSSPTFIGALPGDPRSVLLSLRFNID